MSREARNGRAVLWAALLVAVAAGALYLPALTAGFYSDDYQWLGRMPATAERPAYVFTVFFRDFNPVLHASFFVDWWIAGSQAWAWHLQSILIHALTAGLVALLCFRLGAGLPVGTAAALLWAWNVRLSEAVIWPAARGHQLATLFSLAALLTLLSPLRHRRWLALIFLTIGLFAKETTLVAMAAIPFFLPTPRKEWRFLALLAGLGLSFVLFNLAIKDDLHTNPADLGTLLLKTPFILLRPLGLGDLYGFDIAGLVLVAAAFLVAAWWLRPTPGLAGLIWVLACTAPIVPLEKLSSRYLYMMAVGYSLVLCGAARKLAPRLARFSLRRAVIVALVAGLVVVLGANAVRVQREIGDYRLLGAPYAACVERFRPVVDSLQAGETMVVIDSGPRAEIRQLTAKIAERGNMTKLIPFREHAIDGLIEPADLINASRREAELLAFPADPTRAVRRRWFVHDGREVIELQGPPDAELPPEIVHAATWDTAERFFEETRASVSEYMVRHPEPPLRSSKTFLDDHTTGPVSVDGVVGWRGCRAD